MRVWLSEKVHGYYFIIVFFIGIISGIVISIVANEIFFSKHIFVYFGAIFIFISLLRRRRMFLLTMLIAGLLLGIWRGSVEIVGADTYSKYYGQTVTLRGVVVDDVSIGVDGSQRYKLHSIEIDSKSMSGEIWVSSQSKTNIKRSDTITAKGFLSEGFGSFSASLVRSEVLSVVRTSSSDVGLVARDSFAGATEGFIPEPERSLGLGYLLGIKTNLPEDLKQQIQTLGLTHVVVASGYNLTILVAFSRRLFVKQSKYLSAVTGSAMITGFILITGFSPSMSRAGLVAGLSLLAWYYGRKIHPATLLLVSAGITLFVHPAYIWGDVGWYLSFTAFFGILILAPLIHHYFWGGDKKPSLVRELVIATLSAQILTLPIILYTFGTYSLYALPANLLVLPVVPLSMLATFISGIFGLFLPIIAGLLSMPAVFLLKYCTFVIDKMSALPNSTNEFNINFYQLIVGYVIIGLLTIYLLYKTKHNFLKDKIIVD